MVRPSSQLVSESPEPYAYIYTHLILLVQLSLTVKLVVKDARDLKYLMRRV